MPTYVTVIIVLAIIFYIAANFVATPPPTSLDIMFGKIDFLSFCLHCMISGPESISIDKSVFRVSFSLVPNFMQMNSAGNC